MLEYKINVIEELEKIGINTNTTKKTGIFSQSTMTNFRRGETGISCDTLNRLCCLLELQPRDIFKYVETEDDKENILKKVSEIRVKSC